MADSHEQGKGQKIQEQFIAPRSPENKIKAVQVGRDPSGIPLKGFDSVVAALNKFAFGLSGDSRATQNKLEEGVARMSGAEGLYFLEQVTSDKNVHSFVEDMLTKARHAVSVRGRWSRSFDYDAMGTSFFKSTVDIDRLPEQQDGYLLQLSAAYVGKQVEDKLAKKLVIEQGNAANYVTVTLEPEGEQHDQFRIDFEDVAERLQGVVSELQPASSKKPGRVRQIVSEIIFGAPVEAQNQPLTGERLLNQLLDIDDPYDNSKEVILGVKDGVEVSLNLINVGYRHIRKENDELEDLWRREGAVLTGPLAKSFIKKGALEDPAISVRIRRHDPEGSYHRLPMVDPKMKATANELAAKTAAAFGYTG